MLFTDSASSSRLYEFGYDYDNDLSQSNKKKLSRPNQINVNHGITTSTVGNKSGRGDTNSLSRRHYDRKISKDQQRY